MAYLAGIDEAGYGPNLGPMTQAALVWRLPQPDLDLWEEMSDVICGAGVKDDRIPVADSKALYGATGSLASLERGLFALLPAFQTPPFTLDSLLDRLNAIGLAELRAEFWYDPKQTLPIEWPLEKIATDVARWQEWQSRSKPNERIQNERTFVAITPTPLFNRILEDQGVKSAATALGVVELLRRMRPEFLGQGWDNVVAVDKLGGRNFYGAMLQQAFPDSWIQPIREGAEEGVYRAKLVDPSDMEEEGAATIEIRFQPRAEERYLPVALSSMLAKYLREVLMIQFNAYWQRVIPGLKATAGYPVDAKRFLEAIRATMGKEGIPIEKVWRAK